MQIQTCKDLPDWDWKSGQFKEDSTTFIKFNRNYFDCGIYYFDGTFNVVKFPKGMSVYHGSAVLADKVAEFPVGISYYKPYDISSSNNIALKVETNSKSFLSAIAMTDESIEEVISQSFPISAGWYADPSTGKIYSGISGNDAISNKRAEYCGQKCINSYKLKKDIIMLILDDDYNIAKLFSTDWMPAKEKGRLADMFQIKQINPVRTNEDNPFTRLRYQTEQRKPDGSVTYVPKQRKSSREWDLPFADWICENVIKKQNYSGYAATSQHTEQHSGQFHLEFIFCNAFSWLYRDLNNILDWQHNPKKYPNNTVKIFIEQLGLYQSTNVNFHAGDLLEHSIWTLLFAEKIMKHLDITHPPIQFDNLSKLTAFSAFIHDIGKMYPEHATRNIKTGHFIYFSMPSHPTDGADYINGPLQLPIYDNDLNKTGVMNIDNLFEEFGIDRKYKEIVGPVVQVHWDLGNYLIELKNGGDKNTLAEHYLNKLLGIYNIDRDHFLNFLYIALIVSMADINGSQPYGYDRISEATVKPNNFELNKASHYFPFVTNMPKQYRGGNVAIVSNIDSAGREFANFIMQKAIQEYRM